MSPRRAIEVITAGTRTVPYRDGETGETIFIQTLVWNPTIANLTLMALGSSAPEILLNVIETLQMLGSLPGELGPSTIVGSAAFNLLVITAVSIMSVGTKEDPAIKKVDDMGVFLVTCVFSCFAYVWLYAVLQLWTPGYVTLTEAVLTLAFFAILVFVAFAADKYNATKREANRTDEEKAEEETKKKTSTAKAILRHIASLKGDQYVITAATMPNADHDPMDIKEITKNFKVALQSDELTDFYYEDFFMCLEPETNLERIAFRRNVGNAIGSKRNFVAMKGQVGQVEHRT